MNSEFTYSEDLPKLAPGYHFIVSFQDIMCSQEQLDAIQDELIGMARDIIRKHNLRDASGSLINTRLANYRTKPLLEETLAAKEEQQAADEN